MFILKSEGKILSLKGSKTIKNLQKAFEILHVRNGRELAMMLFERISGIRLSMDFSPEVRSFVAGCFLMIFCLSLFEDNQQDMRRMRRVRIEYRIRRTS